MNERMCGAARRRRSGSVAVVDWQLTSSRRDDDGIQFCGCDGENFGGQPARSRSSIDRPSGRRPVRSPRRESGRSLVLESARISAQRGLVDTIVNTGGNSCKKFEPPVARSRIIFVAVPPSPLPANALRAPAENGSHRSSSVRSGLDNCFELLSCPGRAPLPHSGY